MINRGFSIHKIVVRFLITGGLLIGSHAVFAQETTKNAESSNAPAVSETAAPAVVKDTFADARDIKMGLNLFEGIVRLKNGGAPCNVCHHVENDAVIGGGVLARDLTKAFTRMGAEGVKGMLPHDGSESPFPVMQAAFKGKEITADEVRALVSFLQSADKLGTTQKPAQYSLKIFIGASVGVALMLIFIGLIGRGRKKKSVNSDIYDRQLKSTDVSC